MIVAITGGREITNVAEVEWALENCGFEITLLLEGGCRGVDALAKAWAKRNKVPFATFDADWTRWGKAAGPKRNRHMIDHAHAVVAVWDGKSSGTGGSIEYAKERKLPVFVQLV